MSILAATSSKTKKIVRKVIHSDLRLKSKKIMIKKQKLIIRSSSKSSTSIEPEPTIQRQSSQSTKSQQVSVNLNYFRSFNPYTLGSINSLVLNNGRIYDLMHIKKTKSRQNRITKCTCTKPKCSAKYCDCFFIGESCSSLCQCQNCLNNLNKKLTESANENKICKCSKSQCQKNYCECFQRGDACSSKCQFQNCKNTSGTLTDDNL